MSIRDKIGDTILNSITGKNIKTIPVSVQELADIIYNCFVQNHEDNIGVARKMVKGKFFTYTDVDSPDGNFHFHASSFTSGLTVHRYVWVKNFETEEVFQWKGYTMGPVKRAFEYRLNTGRISSAMGGPAADGTYPPTAEGTPLNRPAGNPKNGSNGNGGRTVLILALAAVALVFGWPTIKSYIKEKNTADGSGYNDTVDKANSQGGSGYGGKADKANAGNADTGEPSVNSDLSTCMGMDYDETLKTYVDSDGSVVFIENDNNKVESIGIYGNGEYSICGLKCGDSQINLPNGFSLVNEIETFDNKKQLYYYSQQKKYLLRVIFDNSTDKIEDIVIALDENGAYGFSDSYAGESESPSYKPYIAGVGDGDSYDDTYEGSDSSGYDGSYDDDDYDDEYYGDDDDSGYYIEYSNAITQKAINARWDNPDSYILPNSDKKKMSEKKLNKLNLRTIQFAIDELCARHGRRFDDKVNSADYGDMKDYFESKNWYQEVSKKYKPQKFDTKIREKVFNEVETYNFFLLAKIRDRKRNQ